MPDMVRWSNAVMPFSTMAVPEAMLEMLLPPALLVTCKIKGLLSLFHSVELQ